MSLLLLLSPLTLVEVVITRGEEGGEDPVLQSLVVVMDVVSSSKFTEDDVMECNELFKEHELVALSQAIHILDTSWSVLLRRWHFLLLLLVQQLQLQKLS